MAKPTIDVDKLKIAELDVTDAVSGQANKVEPSATVKSNGEVYGSFPPVNWMNYWRNLVWQFLTWIVNTVIEGTFTFTGNKTFSGNNTYSGTSLFSGNTSISVGKALFNRGATIIVASSDSPVSVQSGADYVISTGTDAGAALSTIFTALTAAGGGTLYQCAGTYNCTTSILPTSNIVWKGDGVMTINRRMTAALTSICNITSGITNTSLSRLQFDGNSPTYEGTGLCSGIYNASGYKNTIHFEYILSQNNKSSSATTYNGAGFYGCYNLYGCTANNNTVGFHACYYIADSISENNDDMGYNNSLYISVSKSLSNGGDNFYTCSIVSSCLSDGSDENGYNSCYKLTGCQATNNTLDGFSACTEISGCQSSSNEQYGYDDCLYISASRGNSNTNAAYRNSSYISSCMATASITGFSLCINITCCNSYNNSSYGFNGCKSMQQNKSTGNTTANYNTCYADAGTSNAVADTAAGGYNS
jgi:hypothetical protein